MDIVVPDLGETLVEGHVSRWLYRVGDRVEKGASVAELETDKANVDVEAPESGVLHAIACEAGAIVRPGMVLGHVRPGPGGVVTPPRNDEQVARPDVARADRAAARCRFCAALVVAGHVDCTKCGAPH
jgi:2-oxoglutarate dehydrogenase E2 component (dihydrolipoamide succinyltransferase)